MISPGVRGVNNSAQPSRQSGPTRINKTIVQPAIGNPVNEAGEVRRGASNATSSSKVSMEKPSKTADLRCPFCGSKRIRRSHRRAFLEHISSRFLRRRPFRCMDCYERFYSPEQTDAPRLRPLVITDPPTPKPPQEQPVLETNISVTSIQLERRSFSRLPCKIPARVVAGSGPSTIGTLSDISLNGCFIETRNTVSVGDEIELSLEVEEGPRSRALVRRSLPARGMGVEFTSMTVPNFRRLQNIARNSVRLHANP